MSLCELCDLVAGLSFRIHLCGSRAWKCTYHAPFSYMLSASNIATDIFSIQPLFQVCLCLHIHSSWCLIANNRLGQGGFGEVYLCRHRASGTPYALKVLEHSEELSAYPIARECRIARSLKHVSNVNIYGSMSAI